MITQRCNLYGKNSVFTHLYGIAIVSELLHFRLLHFTLEDLLHFG